MSLQRQAGRRLLWMAFVGLWVPATAWPLEPSFNDTWRWAVYTTESGLPSNDIVDLIETHAGTPWVSTRGGVAWFDGYLWHAMVETSESDTDSARGLTAWIDPIGNDEILVTRDRMLYRGDTHGLRRVDLYHEGQLLQVESVAALDDRRILLIAKREGQQTCRIYLLNDRRVCEFETPGKIPSGLPRRLWKTRAGNVWVAGDEGLFRLHDNRWLPMQPAATEFYMVEALVENAHGEGLLQSRYPPDLAGAWAWRRGEPLARVELGTVDPFFSLTITDEGDVIGLCRSGMVKTRIRGSWSNVLPTPVFMAAATFLRITGQQDLWVGTHDGLHLYRMNARRWATWRNADSGLRNVVNALDQGPEGSLWIGTGDGLERRGPDGAIQEWIASAAGVRFMPITGLTFDDKGVLWVCSGSGFQGVLRWDGKNWDRILHTGGRPIGYVHRIIRGQGGGLWFATLYNSITAAPRAGSGAVHYREGRFVHWDDPEGFLDDRIYDITESANGDVWFATVQGLSRWRNGAWTRWSTGQGLLHTKVFALTLDATGRLWFGQSVAGLGYIDADDVPRYVDDPADLRHSSIFSLALDPQQRLWVATSNGVYCRAGDVWSIFSRRCGLENPSVWPVLALKDRVYFGTDGSGTSVLSITEEDRRPIRVIVKPPVIEDATVSFAWAAYAHRGTLPSRAIESRFRLDDGPWSTWQLATHTTFRRLSPGEHRFEVQAKALFGDLSAPGVVTFPVAVPLYLRPNVVVPIGALLLVAGVASGLLLSRARRQAAAVFASESRLQAILDNTPAVIYMKDRQHKYITINRRYEELFHVSRREIVGKTDHEIFDQEAADKFRANDTFVLRNGQSLVIEEVAPHDDGPHTYISVKFPMIDRHGTVYALCGISTDITERKNADEARRLLEEQLRHAQKMEAVGTLASGIAHDFNNLLQAIFGYTELAKATLPQVHPAVRSLEMVEEASRQARGVINALLTFSHKGITHKRPIDLNQTLRASVKLLRRILPAAIEIVEEPSGEDVWVVADDTQIQQIIMNLAVNARDAMPEGGRLVLRVTPGAASDEDAGEVCLRVIDTGIGMSQGVLARLFEPYFTTKPRGRGTGLGMSIIHGIVEDHQGRIVVESTPGRGTRVSVHLPRCRPAPYPAPGAVLQPPAGHGETILVVEDDDHVRSILVSTLRGRGYDVREAADADDAVEQLSSENARIRLLVLDLDLPRSERMMELHQRFLNNGRLPVLRISGGAEPEGRFTASVARRVLRKPFSMQELLTCVSDYLEEPTARTEVAP